MDKKIGNNELCSCGSGKKFKKCCRDKKPRRESIFVDMGTPTIINAYSIGPLGEIEFKRDGQKVDPLSAFLKKWYDKKKGQKILYDIPVDVNNLSLNYLKQFDYIYAIDTNIKEVEGRLMSVCYCAKYNPLTKEGFMRGPICFEDNPNVTEQSNWGELIKDIMKQDEYSSNLKIAIVVDSDYGNIQKYNSRELPIANQFYVPENFTLIYASTDSGIENLPNQMISECDKLAKKYLK